MRVSLVLACAVLLSASAAPAQACGGWGRCATSYPRVRLHIVQRCCQAPAGWGMYRRAKLRHDTAVPLAVRDELGGVIVYPER
jgi:hypothetical protein